MPPRGLRALMREEHARRAANRNEDFCPSPTKRPRTVSNNKVAEPATKGILRLGPPKTDKPRREVKFNDAASQIHEYEAAKWGAGSPSGRFDWIFAVAQLEGGTVLEEYQEDENTTPLQDIDAMKTLSQDDHKTDIATPTVEEQDTTRDSSPDQDAEADNATSQAADSDFLEYELYMKIAQPLDPGEQQHVERIEQLKSVVAQALIDSKNAPEEEPAREVEPSENSNTDDQLADLFSMLDWRTIG